MSLRARIAEGSRAALAEAFTAYRPLAMKVLRQRNRRPADFDDLIQDAFLLLPVCARKCAPGTTLGGCVAAAVIQACHVFDSRKSTHGDGRRRVYLKDGALERFVDPTNPEEATAQRERVHHLSELVEQLPARYREALVARELHGASITEVAAQLGCDSKAAMHATARGRLRLVSLAATSPLAEVFAAMPMRGEGLGMSRAARYRRRAKARTRSQEAM